MSVAAGAVASATGVALETPKVASSTMQVVVQSSVAAGKVARIGSSEFTTLETSQESRVMLESF